MDGLVAMGTAAPIRRVVTVPRRVGNPYIVVPVHTPESPDRSPERVVTPEREPVPVR